MVKFHYFPEIFALIDCSPCDTQLLFLMLSLTSKMFISVPA